MENIHAGHRRRMRAKYIENGIDEFAKHEILELLLFFVIARGNTNDTGHKLMNKFKTLGDVFEADVNELVKVDGIGKKSAEFISFINDMMKQYDKRRVEIEGFRFNQVGGMKFLKGLFAEEPSESRLYMVMLGKQDVVISVDVLAEGDYSYDDIDIRELIVRVMRLNAYRVILVHNHINGNLIPSDEDVRFTRNMKLALSYIDVELNDHIIVGGSSAVSMYNDMRKLMQ